MSYYAGPNGRTASFVLRDRSGKKLSEKSGTLLGRRPRTPGPNDDEDTPVTSPGYEVITVDGITEVIEHRSYATVFYIVDDPKLRRAVGAP
jgi:hypothetical protein